MGMTAKIDTLKIFERLKKADLVEKAAKEIAEVFKDVIEGNLATKEDVQTIVVTTVAQAKIDIIKWVAGMLVAQAALIAALVKLL